MGWVVELEIRDKNGKLKQKLEVPMQKTKGFKIPNKEVDNGDKKVLLQTTNE